MPSPVPISKDQFWDFSVDFYHYKNNKSVFIELQDLAEQNVNLILFLCLLVRLKRPINKELVASLNVSIDELNKKTMAFRQRRRDFKTQHVDMSIQQQSQYQNLLKDELELEKLQQAQLVDTYNGLYDKFSKKSLGNENTTNLQEVDLYSAFETSLSGVCKSSSKVRTENAGGQQMSKDSRLSRMEFLHSLMSLKHAEKCQMLEQRLNTIFLNLIDYMKEGKKFGGLENE